MIPANTTLEDLPAPAERARYLPVFLALNFSGCVSIIGLVSLSLFSSRIHRHAVLLNFYVIWIPYTLCYTLLFLSGHVTGPDPSQLLCTFQAAAIYGAPAMASTATLALVYLVSTRVKHSFKADPKHLTSIVSYDSHVLLILPYIAFAVFFLSGVAGGFKRPDLVGRDRHLYYCTIDDPIGNWCAAFVGIQCFIGLALQVWAAIPVWKHRRALWAMRNRQSTARDGISVRLLIRPGIFSAYLVFEVALCISLFLTDDGGMKNFGILDISIATLPVAVAVVLGSKDFIEALGCHLPTRNNTNVLTTVRVSRPEHEIVTAPVSTESNA